jgi:predicted ester cyclase
MKIIKQYQEGEYIISELIMTGTHEGEWIGITPSHQRLEFSGVDIDRVEDGKIIEHCGAVNTFVALFEHKLISGV